MIDRFWRLLGAMVAALAVPAHPGLAHGGESPGGGIRMAQSGEAPGDAPGDAPGEAAKDGTATGRQLTLPAVDFIDTIGVNTHLGFGSGRYDGSFDVVGALRFSGLRHVRDNEPVSPKAAERLEAVGRAGIKIDFVVNGNGPVDLPAALRKAEAIAPYLGAIEGPNEINLWPVQYAGLGGIAAAMKLQRDLYGYVRSHPTLKTLPVYLFSFGGALPRDFPDMRDMSAAADYANIHTYAPNAIPPVWVTKPSVAGGRTGAASKPVVVTETGYYTLPCHRDWGGVPEEVQARYSLALLFDNASQQISRTYLYELTDGDAAGGREAHFGLFRQDGRPKLLAVGLHRLTALLTSGGAAGRPAEERLASYSAEGVPYNYTGGTLALRRADGSTVIAVWNAEPIWNVAECKPTPSRSHRVVLTLPKAYRSVRVFDPLVQEAPVRSEVNARQLEFSLSDRPIFIEVSSAAPRH